MVRRFYVARWMAAGTAFGCALVLVSWRIAVYVAGPMTFAELHAAHPMMWVVDLLPSILGLSGAFIGVLHLRLTEARRRTEEAARQIAAGWTAELHAANLELAKSLEERQRFYAALSHEMRSPLSSIMGFSQLVDESVVQPPELSGYVAEIYESARILLGMVNDLLEAAKMELGGVQVSLADIDGHAVVDQVVRRLSPLAVQKGLRIRTALGDPVPVRGDVNRLEQVLTNLMSNAIKYSDSGTITVHSGVGSDGRVFYAVKDEGVGIAAADLERVFAPFAQTGSAEGRRDSTGLGLTISRTLVTAMDGELTATSPGLGKGSEFAVHLPPGNGRETEARTAMLAARAG